MLNLKQDLPIEIPNELIGFISEQITRDGLSTINFRDSTYHPENGGFRPVEIMVDKHGDNIAIVYYTEFRYYGEGSFSELGKSNDFDFQDLIFFTEHLGNLPIDESLNETFNLFVKNTLRYVDMECLDEVEFEHIGGHIMFAEV